MEGSHVKLFIWEHKAFICLQFAQMIVMFTLIWLAQFRQIEMLLYIAFIHFFLALMYLVYYFTTRRRLYNKRVDDAEQLSETLSFLGFYPLPEHVQYLLRQQYKQYEGEVIALRSKQDEYLTYVDLWAHQMKTPLAVIELMAQDADEPLSSDLREEVDRLKNGLDMMLHMARLRTVERDFLFKKISVKKMFETLINEHRRLFIRNQIFPKMTVASEDMVVYSDEKWLYFILEQCIHNAVKYSGENGKYVTLVAYETNGKSILEVQDQGVGIPLADQKRVFEPFFTGENGRIFRRESTGIGLYIVAEICEYLGHEVEIESVVGAGTTIRIVMNK